MLFCFHLKKYAGIRPHSGSYLHGVSQKQFPKTLKNAVTSGLISIRIKIKAHFTVRYELNENDQEELYFLYELKFPDFFIMSAS